VGVARIERLVLAERRVARAADQVQMLPAVADREPRAREVERGPLDLLEAEDLALERPRALDVGYRDADVVEGGSGQRAIVAQRGTTTSTTPRPVPA
jgi:hypothetical protein